MATPIFQVGDTVEVIDDHVFQVPKGTQAKVTQVQGDLIGINKGFKEHRNTICWLDSRFKLIKPASMTTTQPRLPNGRFTSIAAPATSLTQVTSANCSVQPILRKGSLYRIVGGPVARYKGTIDGIAVFKVHGKPLAVDTKRVKLADKDDVAAYLSDADLVS